MTLMIVTLRLTFYVDDIDDVYDVDGVDDVDDIDDFDDVDGVADVDDVDDVDDVIVLFRVGHVVVRVFVLIGLGQFFHCVVCVCRHVQ